MRRGNVWKYASVARSWAVTRVRRDPWAASAAGTGRLHVASLLFESRFAPLAGGFDVFGVLFEIMHEDVHQWLKLLTFQEIFEVFGGNTLAFDIQRVLLLPMSTRIGVSLLTFPKAPCVIKLSGKCDAHVETCRLDIFIPNQVVKK